MSKWADLREEKYGMKPPVEGDYTIQDWLADPTEDETGCPLIDYPLIFEAKDDN